MPDDFEDWDEDERNPNDWFRDDWFDDVEKNDPDAAPPWSGPAEAPTPGERLLYVLGQLYRLHRQNDLEVPPADFDIWDLAGIIGVRHDIEFVSERPRGSHWHFADEVLHVNLDDAFPWRLLTMWEWAAEREANLDG